MLLSMLGMDRATGRSAGGLAHLRQSVTDILTTPIGSRVMRRDYGSRLHDLVDSPLNGDTEAELRIATVEAIARWEPRVAVERVLVTLAPLAGRALIALDMVDRETQEFFSVEVAP